MDLCAYTLKMLAISAGTLLWVCYLTYEYEKYSGRRTKASWWEKDIGFCVKNKIRDWRER